MNDDQYFLKETIKVGNQVPAPYNFGAVVVRGGKIVAAEHAHVFERDDPSAHSEVSALVAACQTLKQYPLNDATLYCSHEPCMMCFSCAAWAGIDRIVFVTPASGQDNFAYEFKDVDIFEMAKKLVRPIKVEQQEVTK